MLKGLVLKSGRQAAVTLVVGVAVWLVAAVVISLFPPGVQDVAAPILGVLVALAAVLFLVALARWWFARRSRD